MKKKEKISDKKEELSRSIEPVSSKIIIGNTHQYVYKSLDIWKTN